MENPVGMEKVKVDTEIRKLDQLATSHVHQQHNIRWQVKSLPEQIARAPMLAGTRTSQ